ncbi:hypothetical protein CBOM_04855 [Ceraceosorus bombacis]|uniref:Uncharacterized protein n=1 Tax=Ceraceosorus bombacis TaxID=401625 RepID=A0A0P1BRD5_9BASI|nr:hypothetical protein CBOM_04855 [Ceraceosorus bombacis]
MYNIGNSVEWMHHGIDWRGGGNLAAKPHCPNPQRAAGAAISGADPKDQEIHLNGAMDMLTAAIYLAHGKDQSTMTDKERLIIINGFLPPVSPKDQAHYFDVNNSTLPPHIKLNGWGSREYHMLLSNNIIPLTVCMAASCFVQQ